MIELRHRLIEQKLIAVNGQFTTLVIRNPSFLRKFIIELRDQIEQDKGDFFYFRDGNEASMRKEAFLISDPLFLPRDEKKEQTLLVKEISSLLDESGTNEYENLRRKITDYIKSLSAYSSVPFEIDEEFALSSLLRTVGIKPVGNDSSFLEGLALAISAIGHLFQKKLAIIFGLHGLLELNELEIFHHEMESKDISIVLLEAFRPDCLGACEHIIEIDRDLCEI